MKFLKIISLTIISIVVLAVFCTPFLVKPLLEKNGEKWLGRKVTLENFSLNLFNGTAEITNFKLYEDDKKTAFVSFDTLYIDTEPYQFFTSKIVIEKLYLKSLEATIIKENDSVFNFDSFFSFFTNTNDSVPKEKSEDDFKFSFSNIEFVNADLNFKDRVVGDNFQINAINFLIPNIEWNQEDSSEADLNFSFMDGGSFTSSTQFDPFLGDFYTSVGIKSLNLSSFQSYLQNSLKIDKIEGDFDTDLTFSGNIKRIKEFEVKGKIGISKFSLTDQNKEKILSFEKVHCPIVQLTPLKQKYLLGTLVVEKPYVKYKKYNTSSNLEMLVKKSTPSHNNESKDKNTTEKELFYAVESIEIKNGQIDLVDFTTSKPFQYNLSNMNVGISSIENTTTWLKTQTSLVLNDSGNLVVDLNFNPQKLNKEMEVAYNIKGMKLKDLNIYSVDYMGTPIYSGEMYYKANTSVFDGMLKSDNKIIIHNVSLGDKNGGEYDVPLKFGVFLLKDNNGVVHMDIPVEGDIEKSDVDVNRIIWDAFRNLIIKTVASPGKLLGGVLGVKNEDLEEIRYSYLDTTLNKERLKQLKTLRKLKKKKKGLDISLNYINDFENEKKELAIDLIQKKYMKKKRLNKIEDRDLFVAYVNDKAKTTNLSLEDACMRLVDEEKVNSLAIEYNMKRINTVKNYLNKMNPEDPIQVTISDDLTEEERKNPAKFIIQYAMSEE